jgi:putative ABC transport system substrate-binding protein
MDMRVFMTPCSRAYANTATRRAANLIVERRYARGQAERFKEFAAEMVRLNVDVIVVVTTPAALAVMNATKTIPIVHPNAIDPLNTGLIASLAHPGGNLIGGAQLTARDSPRTTVFSICRRFSCMIISKPSSR